MGRGNEGCHLAQIRDQLLAAQADNPQLLVFFDDQIVCAGRQIDSLV
jgi:hypothetical protein